MSDVHYNAGLQHLKKNGFPNMTSSALRSRVRRGTIPHIRRKLAKYKAVRFDLAALDQWIAGQRGGPGEP